MIKRILLGIVEPLKALSNRKFAEKAAEFFEKNNWAVYVLSLLITLTVMFLVYILPNITR
jgi:hypothetical protein